jgi:S1-C subfamily serine protease
MFSSRQSKSAVKPAASIIALSLMLSTAFGQMALNTAQIAKRVSPSVVVIEGKTDSGDVLGSGFIVSKDGKIVTNLHVIRDMRTASVHLANGGVFDFLSVLATDERRDLAVVKIAGFDLPILALANADAPTVGEPVVILANALPLSHVYRSRRHRHHYDVCGWLSALLGYAIRCTGMDDACVNGCKCVGGTGLPSTAEQSDAF